MPATTAAPSGSRFETTRRPFTTVGEGIGVGVGEGLGVAVAVGLAVPPVIGIVQAPSVTENTTRFFEPVYREPREPATRDKVEN